MMTPELRKVLEAKRQHLESEVIAATARANQARGGIGMIDTLLALPDIEAAPAPAKSPRRAKPNGKDAAAATH